MSNKINMPEIAKSLRTQNVQETVKLLQSSGGIFWSWGSHAFRAEVNNGDYTKYFRMAVSGHHHKGHVWIILNGIDLFDVYFTSRQGTIKDIKTDLYFDMLVDCIDKYVEYIPEYVNN